MKDFPGYGRIRGAGGPRTKKQLRKIRQRLAFAAAELKYRAYQEEMLELERRKPTLHDVDWKP